MIVVKLFGLYRHLSPDIFVKQMLGKVSNENIGTDAEPLIHVPFFKDAALPDLPAELEEALIDALRVQVRQFFFIFV